MKSVICISGGSKDEASGRISAMDVRFATYVSVCVFCTGSLLNQVCGRDDGGAMAGVADKSRSVTITATRRHAECEQSDHCCDITMYNFVSEHA